MAKITLAHGNGGIKTKELVKEVFSKAFSNEILEEFEDAAYINGFAFTTDSFVVKPHTFPGGDIGKLSVCGTVNDLLVSGAVPLFLSFSVIIEEGFSMEDLKKYVTSASDTAVNAGVKVVCGDTKVVEKGACDGIFINTSGLGRVVRRFSLKDVSEGDFIVVSGSVGDHGICMMLLQENIEVEVNIKSDCSPLNSVIIPLFDIEGVKWMRDPTRGGLAEAVLELCEATGLGVELYEKDIPVREEVKFLCDMLGYDPLYMANEGKVLVVVDESNLHRVMDHLLSFDAMASVIGRITGGSDPVIITDIGGKRRIEHLEEDPLPRIC